jgi:hypothetical protein
MFYKLDKTQLAPWGDYGDILHHGMTSHLGRTNGLLSLERTGPYMPPITFSGIGDVVLNGRGRMLLEASGLTGFEFRPVHKAHIVRLPWQDWDLAADMPPILPESGEPEDYILEAPHDPQVADELGDVWELVVPETAIIGRPRPIVSSFRDLHLEVSSWIGTDLFRGSGFGGLLYTEHAKVWFEKNLAPYVAFEEFYAR